MAYPDPLALAEARSLISEMFTDSCLVRRRGPGNATVTNNEDGFGGISINSSGVDSSNYSDGPTYNCRKVPLKSNRTEAEFVSDGDAISIIRCIVTFPHDAILFMTDRYIITDGESGVVDEYQPVEINVHSDGFSIHVEVANLKETS